MIQTKMKGNINKLTILVIIAMLVALATLSVGPVQTIGANDTVKLQWSLGWDDLTKPLDLNSSFVEVTPDDDALRVVYSLEGARPNTSHNVGFLLFWDSTSECVTTFGQLTTFLCVGPLIRQGFTTVVEGFNLGVLTTDAAGNGKLTVDVNGIAPATYNLEFEVSISTCNLCARIYQSPGPTFGGTFSITIPHDPDAITAVSDLRTALNGLADSDYQADSKNKNKDENNRQWFSKKVDALEANIEDELFEDALDNANNILRKVDGCENSSAPDRNDKILNCTAQGVIYPLVIELIDLLEELI